MTDLTALIEALERAEGPRRDLDVKIWLALFDKQIMVDAGGYGPRTRPVRYKSAREIWTDDWPHWNERIQVDGVALELGAPHYTASIDAALTLVPSSWTVTWHNAENEPEQFPVTWSLRDTAMAGDLRWRFEVMLFYDHPNLEPREISEADAPTAALALCIACLKARQNAKTASP